MKTEVIYEGYNPNREGLTHVAIQTETTPKYVWCTYFARDEKDLPRLGTDMLILPIETARNRFDFKKGKLADITS